jgi:hypothetical protein
MAETKVLELPTELLTGIESTVPGELRGRRKESLRVASVLRRYLEHPEIHLNRPRGGNGDKKKQPLADSG